jgi:hypothetical protein
MLALQISPLWKCYVCSRIMRTPGILARLGYTPLLATFFNTFVHVLHGFQLAFGDLMTVVVALEIIMMGWDGTHNH